MRSVAAAVISVGLYAVLLSVAAVEMLFGPRRNDRRLSMPGKPPSFGPQPGEGGALLVSTIAVILVLACIAAWATHVIVCLKTASWGFLIAGAIAAPVAVVHGVGIWLGVW
jgi:hypothetical protein